MNNKLILIGLAFLSSAAAQAQTVYTWEDEHGVVHFSDSPMEQHAKKLILPDYQAAAPAPKFENSTPVDVQKPVLPEKKPTESKQDGLPVPLKLSLIHPQHDQTIRSNQGLVDIEITINRKLAIGEQFQLILDGRRYGAPQTQRNWQLKNIDRGTHTISIQAHRSGKLIASTSPATVYLHRATVK